MTLAGRRHPALARVRALRRDRSARDAEGVVLAEGIHLAREALACGVPIELALVSPRLERSEEGSSLRRALEQAGAPLVETSDELLDAAQDARAAQPVLLVVRRRDDPLDGVVRGRAAPALLVVAAGIQDPGSLGAILRSADALGATGLVASGGADLHHPRAVRASMGGLFRLPCSRAGLEAVAPLLLARGILRVGTVPRGGEPPGAVDLAAPVALFLGAEGGGLPRSLPVDRSVTIPMQPGAESLSVAAAAAILLHEAARRRGGGS